MAWPKSNGINILREYAAAPFLVDAFSRIRYRSGAFNWHGQRAKACLCSDNVATWWIELEGTTKPEDNPRRQFALPWHGHNGPVKEHKPETVMDTVGAIGHGWKHSADTFLYCADLWLRQSPTVYDLEGEPSGLREAKSLCQAVLWDWDELVDKFRLDGMPERADKNAAAIASDVAVAEAFRLGAWDDAGKLPPVELTVMRM